MCDRQDADIEDYIIIILCTYIAHQTKEIVSNALNAYSSRILYLRPSELIELDHLEFGCYHAASAVARFLRDIGAYLAYRLRHSADCSFICDTETNVWRKSTAQKLDHLITAAISGIPFHSGTLRLSTRQAVQQAMLALAAAAVWVAG